MSTKTIGVMIVDDHRMVREGLAVFVQAYDDLRLVGEAPDGADAIALCGEVHPDVILMDLNMPNVNGIEATQAIREQYPDVQVLLLTTSPNLEQLRRALDAGAAGFLTKNVRSVELAAAIRAASLGGGVPEAGDAASP